MARIDPKTEPEIRALPHPTRMLLRGLVRHCPRCGGGGLFASWMKMRERCPTCDLKFEREEGAFLGAFVVNFGFILLVVAAYIAITIATISDPDPVMLAAVGVALTVVVPILFYPFSRTIWTAIDLMMLRGL